MSITRTNLGKGCHWISEEPGPKVGVLLKKKP
jgi:hypothetical protein